MGVSRVDFDGETLIDLTDDTVTPQSLLSGYSAHNKAGELIEGLAVIPTKVSELKNDSKFITETGDSSKTTVTFEQAVKRANVNSGDDLSTAFSKLSKFCNDLKPHAFSTPSSDLLTTVPGFSLDATMGKKLKDFHDANKNEIDALNSKLVGRMNFIHIGNTPYNNTSPIKISFDMKNYNMVYAVGYASNISKYVGGLFMPKFFFHMHPQMIDYYDYWSGVVDYNDTLKKFTITSNIEGYQLYIYAVNV